MKFPSLQAPQVIQHDSAEQFTPYAENYEDKYYSAESGLAESQYVFLRGNDLPNRWQNQSNFCIAELGFGTGLNFFATWQAWQNDPQRSARLTYFSVEFAPLAPETITELSEQWPELKPFVDEFLAAYPKPTPGHHCLRLAGGQLTLWLCFGEAKSLIDEWQIAADAWFLDGFAPSRNPEMWSRPLLKRIGHNSNIGATLATFTAASQVQKDLRAAGFEVTKTSGFNGKRERITAVFAPPSPKQSSQLVSRIDDTQRIWIIGSGVAGLHLAEALIAEGFDPKNIHIIGPEQSEISQHDSQNQTLATTSQIPAALVLPQISREKTLRGYLHWQAFVYARQHYQRNKAKGISQTFAAIRQLPPQFAAEQETLLSESLSTYQIPKTEAEMSADDLRYHAAVCVSGAEYLSTLSAQLIEQGVNWHRAEIISHSKTELRIQPILSAEKPQTIELNQHDQVVFCTGAGTSRLIDDLPLHTTRGQLNIAKSDAESAQIQTLYSRHIYVTPALRQSHKSADSLAETYHYLGSTFDRDRRDIELDELDAKSLQQRWRDNLADLPAEWEHGKNLVFDTPVFAGLRLHTADRMPLAGPMPDSHCLSHLDDPDWQKLRSSKPHFGVEAENLCVRNQWIFAGFGAHGFSLSPLLAAALAAQILGKSQPMQKSIMRRCHPLWQMVISKTSPDN